MILISMMLFTFIALTGCSDDSNPVSAFEPEIINNADAFQFQITDAVNVNTILNYNWTNTGSQAPIDHSSVLSEGTATVKLYDADGTEVYSNDLVASLNESSSVGTAGIWNVQIIFVNASGTFNIRVEKL